MTRRPLSQLRRRKGISSIYGFIVIFLLTMASIQTWSSAVGSLAAIQSSYDEGNQLEQMQSVEHLVLQEVGSNLTITNDGQVPSTVQFLRLSWANDSSIVPIGTDLAVGSSMTVMVPVADSVEVVTALGNVFATRSASDPVGTVWEGAATEGGLSNAQLFENPYAGSSFYLSDGPEVYALSDSGSPEWSFDAGAGYVTDVLPLASGVVYVSVGYGSTSNYAELFELDSGGGLIRSYDVRLFQTPDGPSASSLPVVKGQDESYALYDGWFYSQNGPTGAAPSDSFPLAGSSGSDFYFYQVTPDPYNEGVCQQPGNQLVVYSYAAPPGYPGGVSPYWKDYSYFGACNSFPEQLVGAAVGGGAVALLMASPPYAAGGTDDYSGQNPYLVVDSGSGQTLYDGEAPSTGYDGVATNGTDVYLALPEEGQVQVLSLGDDAYTTHSIGIQASQLLYADDHLFAVSRDAVDVFSPSMTLEKTIDLSPLSLASFSDSFLQETALRAPSFLVLNATSYAALLVNSTGSAILTVGRYD